jgi:hypothetical protein
MRRPHSPLRRHKNDLRRPRNDMRRPHSPLRRHKNDLRQRLNVLRRLRELSLLPHQVDNLSWNDNHFVWHSSVQLFDGPFVFHDDFLNLFFG